jgi:hypothetical protein
VSSSYVKSPGRWAWLIIWSVVFLACIAAVVIADLAHWHPWANVPATRIAWYHHEECEQVYSTGILLQLANFWSNFAYLAIALLIATHDSLLGRVIGATFVLLTFGSGWFHGSLSEYGQTVDIAGVYCGLLAIASYGIVELTRMQHTDPRAWLLMIAAIILGVVGAILRTQVHFFDSDYFTPLLVVIVLVFGVVAALRLSGAKQPLLWPGVMALLAGLVALVFKFTDGDDNLLAQHHGVYLDCTYHPTSLFQGHAVWHVLSAYMFLCMFEFFNSIGARFRTVFPWR